MTSVPVTAALAKPLPVAANRRTLAVVFLYFLIAGAATVMLGPALPLLAVRWGLADAQLGTLFVACFAGQICGAWLAAWRLGQSLLFGAATAAAGFLLLATAGAATAHFLLFFLGLGLGAGLTAGNVIVGTMYDSDRSRPTGGGSTRSRLLALLNVSWGVGAIACPLWLRVSLSLSQSSTGTGTRSATATLDGELFLFGLGVAFATVAGLIVWLLPRSFYRPAEARRPPGRLPWRSVWMFVATLMLYVGVENALGGWLPSYAQRLQANSGPGGVFGGMSGGMLTGRASSIALCFWISQLAGRGLLALMVKPTRERSIYRGCLLALIAAVGILVLAPNWNTPSIFTLTAIVALCLAPLFPLAVSFLLARTGNHPWLGRVFASSSLGGSVLPWLTGVCSTHFRSLRIGFVVPGIGAALLLLLSARLRPQGESAEHS
jgi:fucose permease